MEEQRAAPLVQPGLLDPGDDDAVVASTGTMLWTVSRSQPVTPSSTGSPPGSRRQRVGVANRSMPLVANVVASCCCSVPRKFTTAVEARSMCGQDEVDVPMPKETSGGASESELSEVAVKPTGPPPESAVTTTTPAGYLRKACLKRSGAIPGTGAVVAGSDGRTEAYEDTVTVNVSPRSEGGGRNAGVRNHPTACGRARGRTECGKAGIRTEGESRTCADRPVNQLGVIGYPDRGDNRSVGRIRSSTRPRGRGVPLRARSLNSAVGWS